MNYEDMISAVEALNERQAVHKNAVPHGNNLLHQLLKREAGKEPLYENILSGYIQTRSVPYSDGDLKAYITAVVEKTNRYMDLFWPPVNNPFSHQADFTSSIIPEMFCTVFGNIIRSGGAGLEVSAQKDLAIECAFDISGGGRICFKNKRVDIAVVKPCLFSFQGVAAELPIPLLAIECKTNLDKNMLSGIEHSVTELKKTFPNCHYFVVTECSDFDVRKLNYASSGIEEMYVLRKQKRSAVRKDPARRNPIDASPVYEVAKALISSIDAMNVGTAGLAARMRQGKLIGRGA